MGEVNPVDDPELYDAIELGGTRSPGTVKLSGHNRKIGWDIKTAKGQKGATTTLKDIPPIEFSAAFFLADNEDFDAWPAFDALIRSTVSGANPKSLDVYHPDLARNEIHSVVLAEFGGVIHDGKGGQTITVKFQEYKPPKPKGGTASGSKSNGKTPDPNQAALDELARLTKQYADTPWG